MSDKTTRRQYGRSRAHQEPDCIKLFRRRSIRLPDYDYSQPGAYFVTMVSERRRQLFGRIEDGQVLLSPAGRLVERVWNEIPLKFPTVFLDYGASQSFSYLEIYAPGIRKMSLQPSSPAEIFLHGI